MLGCEAKKDKTMALVDSDDIHCLMIGASGVGKTAFFLYPNLEYACASGMSFLALDTKGDLARNYGTIAKKYYGYNVSVIDLRNPTRSDGNNLLTLINRYMDIAKSSPDDLAARAKAEKLVSQEAIYQEAKHQCQDMIVSTKEKIAQLRKASNEYMDDALRRTEDAIAQSLGEVRDTRAKFRALAEAQEGREEAAE